MRENYIYSERLGGIESEPQQKPFSQADPAQFDPYIIRSWSSKEISSKEELEKELMETY